MFNVTIPAAARMTELLVPRADEAVLRIVRRSGRFRLRVSQVRPGDWTFPHCGKTVLALDERMSHLLARRFIDVVGTTAGPRLKLASR